MNKHFSSANERLKTESNNQLRLIQKVFSDFLILYNTNSQKSAKKCIWTHKICDLFFLS